MSKFYPKMDEAVLQEGEEVIILRELVLYICCICVVNSVGRKGYLVPLEKDIHEIDKQ